MLDKARESKETKAAGGAGPGGMPNNPFGPEGLMKAMQNPKIAGYMQDPQFAQTVNMCM